MSLTDNIIAIWHMNATWKDSWNSHDGTASGAIFSSSTKKLGTHSGKFDGTDDWVSVDDSADLSFGDASTDSPFSISMWINRDQVARNDYIIGKKSGSNVEWQIIIQSANSGQIAFILYDNTSTVRIDRRKTNIDAVLTATNWHHIVATYDGSSTSAGMKIYINNSRVDNASDDAGVYVAMHDTANPVNIGRAGITTAYFKGLLDEVVIWNKELTTAEISELYNGGNGLALGTIVTDSFPSKKQIAQPIPQPIPYPGTNENNKWIIGG